jgi:glycosyltransferase involved in cell wall biosynthesis
VYEGLSIALLEAQQWGCPIVTADVGGNAEALVDGAALVHDPTDIAAYVDGLLRVQRVGRKVAERPAYPDLVPRIWSLLGAHGVEDGRPRSGVLFVTNNLNMGGTQRSLTNLLVDMPDKNGASVCVLGAIHGRQFLNELTDARVPVISFDKPANIVDSAERVLDVAGRLNVRTLCFWNADACVKLLVSKILACTSVRIVDVSPGSPLFRELDETNTFQDRIAYTEADYAARLDTFVCKCQVGSSHPRLANWKTRVVVIPNGVRTEDKPQVVETSTSIAMRIGTCGRVAPENRIEFLMESFAIVAERIKDASLTIVGEAQASHHRYREFLLKQAMHMGLKNLHFVGPTHDVNSHLRSFRVFVTAFDGEGCSNAVLESMAAGTPVVAAASDSNRELIRNGVDGFVVSNPQEMAAKIEILLTRPELADSMGRASASTVRQHFSMSKMVNRYRSVLAC